jgi:nucleotide-binding universal stress UspA family protein
MEGFVEDATRRSRSSDKRTHAPGHVTESSKEPNLRTPPSVKDQAQGLSKSRGIPMNHSIVSILHPTDFSDLSGVALAHALRIALATKGKLDILHVEEHDTGGALAFPHVRRLLVQWGLSEEDDPPWVVATKLGIEVQNIRIKWQEPTQGIAGFLDSHPCDLIVLATHGRDGFEHWLRGSVSEAVARRSSVPTLFIAPGARGFVSQITGDVQLRRALIPVDFSPEPGKALEIVQLIGRLLTGSDISLHLLHIGRSAPSIHTTSSNLAPLPPVMLRYGNVVKSIVDVAIEFDVDFIGMPTAGHRGIFDALRGSTTERVIRHAPCPVFAVPDA